MNNFKLEQSGVWVPNSQYPSVKFSQLDKLINDAPNLKKKRSRICVHPSANDAQQEMFIAFSGDSYIQPSYHTIDESFHLIRGAGKYVFFDKDGNYESDVRLGSYDSDLAFYVRVPAKTIHTLIPLSKQITAHEVIGGKFSRKNTVFPDWSKSETDENLDEFFDKYAYHPVSKFSPIKLERISEEAFQCKDKLVYLRRHDIENLKKEMPLTKRKRIRILTHPDSNHAIHEIFVVYSNKTFVMANMHLGKDESLHILEGEADFIFFDEKGNVTEVVRLSTSDPNKDFFVRVPKNTFHTIIMRSPVLVIHEATPGPFKRSDTIWADWCPKDSQVEESKVFSEKLEKELKKFK